MHRCNSYGIKLKNLLAIITSMPQNLMSGRVKTMNNEIIQTSPFTGDPISQKKGFTLIELMLALTVLIFVVLGTSSTIINVARIAANARKTTLASDLCQSKIEEIRSFGYNATFNSDEYNIDAEGNSGGIFNRTVRVNNGPIPNTKSLIVTVSWTDFIKTHKVIIPTIIANITI